MYFIDSHCHLHDERIYKDIPNIISRSETAGVQYMVTCATMEKNFMQTAGLAMEYGSVLPCFGIHPWFVDSLSENWQQNLETFLTSHRSGIGETGLDFMDKKADRDLQLRVFSHHLNLASELERPINIHIRKAWDVFIHLLKKIGPLKKPGLIHSYSGSADMIPLFERYNLYISFSGAVTRPNARKVIKALGTVSRDRILLETDTPDIYPSLGKPLTNKLNEPENLPVIAKIAAQRSHLGFEEFVSHAYHNGLTLFNPILPGE
ncbi:MAG: TatD family hydrolase [Desulfobacula sp.]|nr:TatD family hydrolase [Desulfobacula sp.]